MIKQIKYIAASVLVMAAFIFVSNAYAGKMELTTYYPAPWGEYKNLESTEGSNFATTSGSVGIGTTAPQGKFAVSALSATNNDDQLVIYSPTSNVLAIQTILDGRALDTYGVYGGGQNQLVLQPLTGFVGIGTAAPLATLDVAGKIVDRTHSSCLTTTPAILKTYHPGCTEPFVSGQDFFYCVSACNRLCKANSYSGGTLVEWNGRAAAVDCACNP